MGRQSVADGNGGSHPAGVPSIASTARPVPDGTSVHTDVLTALREADGPIPSGTHVTRVWTLE